MNVHFLHNITGITFVLSLLAKIMLHYYLDHLYNRSLGFNSIFTMPLQYILPYKSKVNTGHRRLKYLCNAFLLITYISLFLNIIFGVVIQ